MSESDGDGAAQWRAKILGPIKRELSKAVEEVVGERRKTRRQRRELKDSIGELTKKLASCEKTLEMVEQDFLRTKTLLVYERQDNRRLSERIQQILHIASDVALKYDPPKPTTVEQETGVEFTTPRRGEEEPPVSVSTPDVAWLLDNGPTLPKEGKKESDERLGESLQLSPIAVETDRIGTPFPRSFQ